MTLTASIKQQWRLWLVALSFFTRIKVKPIDEFKPEYLNQANRYYGLVGLYIGTFSVLIFWLSSLFFPPSIAIILSMITSVLLTGGFHEDGLADTWDGFGGGWTVEQKLTIMKDSRLGTYGALALFLTLLLKFQLLLELATQSEQLSLFGNVIGALLVGHCLSRVLAVSLIFDQTYVRDIDSSKVKPMTKQQTPLELIILLTSALIPLYWLPLELSALLITGLICLRFIVITWYQRQLGGYTGDLLGQAQQLAEIVIYLILLAYIVN
ncbi:adenosylcobinamide-GDP ribazoletransferase [Psychrobium sp. 1_MG-2023]|uniref:adenosylcobinamide-GDP ribazoletransferase n=1 Tax=Psychrobium sp. 1_MG-2023 TaxID=3062624 RepID=UPI000C3378CC|nr:adenosylcobinamide-GDP ribazoletransferase [Psychrobium sp. 1_MG-2023]MDP2559710.1 adenosylcobinamide-GDP ribazoletransferase [Psychrobium sp. 1_MG-2023]PKF59569.1 adenosylcobinamide-GDP ribazoletransferase [Alteromonadales bacterium alter-6D02]